MKPYSYICVLLLSGLVANCGGCDDGDKAVTVYTSYIPINENYHKETSEDSDNVTTDDWEEAVVPYRNKNGVKYVDVKVNGVGLEMIFDTGCSDMHISVAEARYLYAKGTLTDDDFLGLSPVQTADGNVSVDMVVNLREVAISDLPVRYDVSATVSYNNEAPPLLGNGVLDSIELTTIDSKNHNLIFRYRKK